MFKPVACAGWGAVVGVGCCWGVARGGVEGVCRAEATSASVAASRVSARALTYFFGDGVCGYATESRIPKLDDERVWRAIGLFRGFVGGCYTISVVPAGLGALSSNATQQSSTKSVELCWAIFARPWRDWDAPFAALAKTEARDWVRDDILGRGAAFGMAESRALIRSVATTEIPGGPRKRLSRLASQHEVGKKRRACGATFGRACGTDVECAACEKWCLAWV